MTTLVKRKPARKVAKETKALAPEAVTADEGRFEPMDIAQIDICPRNYRKIFLKKDIEDFSKELKKHGIISSLVVRPMPSGRHELVVGERRYRAAKLAKIGVVPVQIRVLTDEEANEIRLAENIHRENPHPLHEAYAVKDMLDARGSIDEVAKRMGKSKAFVYSRIKISELTEQLQEVFLADKFTISEAEAIASLSPQSQLLFFEQYYGNWEQDNFYINDIPRAVSRLKCDLQKAPFSLEDPELFPEAGACTICPHNSATLSYLFPELAKDAKCCNSTCYATKCEAQLKSKLLEAYDTQKPDAILHNGRLDAELEAMINAHDDMEALPKYNRYAVRLVNAPEPPDREDFDDEGENGEPLFDETGYAQALQEYHEELEEYHSKTQSAGIQRGLNVINNNFRVDLFELYGEEEDADPAPKVTAKEVQEAIKAGTVTVDLLEAEITRLTDRETRSKEIDLDKIQKLVHEKFKEQTLSFPDIKDNITDADQVALRLIVFQSLDWQMMEIVKEQLMPDIDFRYQANIEAVYEALAALTEEQFCFLVRVVLAGNSQSQYPGNITGRTLYRCAEASGIDVPGICGQQAEIAEARAEKCAAKVEDLKKKIKKMARVA